MARVSNREYRSRVLSLLETEVKLYHETVRRLKEGKEDIIYERKSEPDSINIKSPGVGDPTSKKAMAIYNSHEIANMGKTVRAIERAKDEFCQKEPGLRMRYIDLRFWDGKLTNAGIAAELKMGESTVRTWRGKFLELVAMYLGWRLVP